MQRDGVSLVKRRSSALVIFIVLVFGVFSIRLFQLQIGEGKNTQSWQARARISKCPFGFARGDSRPVPDSDGCQPHQFFDYF